jgi:hypothetical protein
MLSLFGRLKNSKPLYLSIMFEMIYKSVNYCFGCMHGNSNDPKSSSGPLSPATGFLSRNSSAEEVTLSLRLSYCLPLVSLLLFFFFHLSDLFPSSSLFFLHSILFLNPHLSLLSHARVLDLVRLVVYALLLRPCSPCSRAVIPLAC